MQSWIESRILCKEEGRYVISTLSIISIKLTILYRTRLDAISSRVHDEPRPGHILASRHSRIIKHIQEVVKKGDTGLQYSESC